GRFAVEVIRPTAATELSSGDTLLIDVSSPSLEMGAGQAKFPLQELPLTGGYFADRSQDIGMGEAIVPPTSELIGKTVVEAAIRPEFGPTVIGFRRRGGGE